MTGFKLVSAVGVAMLIAAGCDQRNRDRSPAAQVAPASASVQAPAPSSAPARPSASAALAPRESNAWKGTYEAAKATLETPDKVRDVTWKNDPGDQALGKGAMAFGVASDGQVRGSASGALGPQRVVGVFDGESLRFSLMPEDATAPGAMTGTGYGKLEQGAVRGTLRCAGPDGVVVRQAAFEVKPSN